MTVGAGTANGGGWNDGVGWDGGGGCAVLVGWEVGRGSRQAGMTEGAGMTVVVAGLLGRLLEIDCVEAAFLLGCFFPPPTAGAFVFAGMGGSGAGRAAD